MLVQLRSWSERGRKATSPDPVNKGSVRQTVALLQRETLPTSTGGPQDSDVEFPGRLPTAVVQPTPRAVITEDLRKLASSAPPATTLLTSDHAAVTSDFPPAISVTSDAESGSRDWVKSPAEDQVYLKAAGDDVISSRQESPSPEVAVTERLTEEKTDVIETVPAADTGPTEIGPPVDPGEETVTVRLRPDPDDRGRYGFNVKGGAGGGGPHTVSKVAPQLADRLGGPTITEGDQVMLINGSDVSGMTHDEVVRLITALRDKHIELELTVKHHVKCDLDVHLGEPLVRFVPDEPPVSLTAQTSAPSSLPGAGPVASSVAAIAEGLASGAARLEFEHLPRHEPGLAMDDCRLPHNLHKNRYRDIAPYDCTRVFLHTADSGDYINANFVNMEIPGTCLVNRYIAAQGPLPHTCEDFWAMVWEQQSPLIVMLTTLVEQGRVKCHQYWPDLGHSLLTSQLEVITVSEEVTESFAFRQIRVTSHETGETRHVQQMQYISWPDHGVPERPEDFVQFVRRVRAARAGLQHPTVVHCSAGIGRTGVLILMETAMCQIEAGQPVRPLRLVAAMRRQRAMMIQTSSQFEFVCRAVVQAYEDGTARPLCGESQS